MVISHTQDPNTGEIFGYDSNAEQQALAEKRISFGHIKYVPKPIDSSIIKSAKWDEIKSERDRLQIDGGVNVAGHWYLSTERATSEYNTIVNATRSIPTDSVIRKDWRTMDGAKVDMTPALALQILSAGIAQRCAIDDAAMVHKSAMEASADPASYDFSGGWPETFKG